MLSLLISCRQVLGAHASHDPDDGPLWDVMICGEGARKQFVGL